MIGRVITAAVGIPALALVVWLGDPVFSVVVAALAALAAIEVCDLARSRGLAPARIVAAVLSAALVLSHFAFSALWSTPEYLPLLIVSAGIAVLALILTLSPIQRIRNGNGETPSPLMGEGWGEGEKPGSTTGYAKASNAGLTLAAVLYPGALLAHAPLLRGGEQGLEWIALLLVVTFSTDTGAFFVGKAIGKRPLAPTISPNKTWEGAIGGFAAAILAAFIAAWALNIDTDLPLIAVLGALMGVVGQAGDLFESKLKRLADVKESGRLLPGHGGVLDRLDSIVFNLALVYYFVIGGVL
ncbi:MAG: phosphatidate cytidylyltransferase [Chloroflexota bacterium]|nr:phosphatidate cytidylyltransferase [Chloroflexota bacterium]